ncbi:MAG: PorT family protein [Bacteroidales bacterium]|jgi:hypothetical protein|nr:PorT family protein [Bacteroidales bacterium]
MKKYMILCGFVVLFAFTGNAQRFVGAAILGINATQVDGDEIVGYYKIGVRGGASVMVALDKKQSWFLTLELIYNQRGSFRRSLVDSMSLYSTDLDNINTEIPYNKDVKYKLNMDYVQVPVLVHYEDPKTGVAFGAGFAWGRLVRLKELENGYTMKTNLKSGIYKLNDWSVIGDVKIRLWKGLKLGARFEYSLDYVRKRTFTGRITGETWTRYQFHNALSLSLIYAFNEKYALNMKRNKKGERIGPKWVRDIDNPVF